MAMAAMKISMKASAQVLSSVISNGNRYQKKSAMAISQ
jgi:hypothetical protein